MDAEGKQWRLGPRPWVTCGSHRGALTDLDYAWMPDIWGEPRTDSPRLARPSERAVDEEKYAESDNGTGADADAGAGTDSKCKSGGRDRDRACDGCSRGCTACGGVRIPVAVTVGMDGEVRWWRQPKTEPKAVRGRGRSDPKSADSSSTDSDSDSEARTPRPWEHVMTRCTGRSSGPLWTVQAQCRGVFAGAADGTVTYWGCAGELRRTFRDSGRRHQVLCLRAVGRVLLTGGSDGWLRGYHVPTGRILWRLRLM